MAVKKEDLTGVVRSTDLEVNMGKTIMAEYTKEMDNRIISGLNQKGYNISLPGVCNFVDGVPELQERLIRLYDGTMGLCDEVTEIPFQLKVAQGALLDGLCFGYDVDDRSFALYTMNFKVLFNMNITDIDMAKQCMEKNKKGQLKGYRIDVEYNETPGEFSFKAVNHRKTIDDEEHVFLIPYLAVVRLMKLIEHFLDGNAVLKTVQDLNGMEKMRCITKNTRVLEKFSDVEGAYDGVSPVYFPLRAFFYAPVLGAPSTTSMVTRINLFDLCEIKRIQSAQALRNLGVERCPNAVDQMVLNKSISQVMSQIQSSDPELYAQLIAKCPESDKYFNNIQPEDISESIFAKYMHSLKNADLITLGNMIPGVQEQYNAKKVLFKGYTPMDLKSDTLKPENLRKLLKSHICQFIIRKKDCTLSSIMCTNSPQFLTAMYGEGYFGRYEGFNVRFNAFIEELSLGRPLEDALEANGFKGNDEFLKICKELEEKAKTEKVNFVQELKDRFAEESNARQRASSNTNAIMVRTCNAYISGEGTVVDYYRYVDPNKIVKAALLG